MDKVFPGDGSIPWSAEHPSHIFSFLAVIGGAGQWEKQLAGKSLLPSLDEERSFMRRSVTICR